MDEQTTQQQPITGVEARFYVSHVGKRPRNSNPGESIGTVELQASTKGPHDWSEWTPTGSLTLGTLNPAALAWFDAHLGQDVALTFSELPTDSE